jgi:hypothetical protein
MNPASAATHDRGLPPRRAPWAWRLAVTLLVAPMLAAAGAWSITDDDGHTLSLSAPAQRIVSLSPGATALLFAAGAGAQIVGTSEYSIEPEAARNIPRVGDSQSFDSELILSLHPDVVIAWVDGTPEAQIARIERLGIPVYRHHVQRLDDLAVSIRRLGQLAGTQAVAQASAAALEQQLRQIRAQFHSDQPPSILIQIWQSPVYTVGSGRPGGDPGAGTRCGAGCRMARTVAALRGHSGGRTRAAGQLYGSGLESPGTGHGERHGRAVHGSQGRRAAPLGPGCASAGWRLTLPKHSGHTQNLCSPTPTPLRSAGGPASKPEWALGVIFI